MNKQEKKKKKKKWTSCNILTNCYKLLNNTVIRSELLTKINSSCKRVKTNKLILCRK